jgi:hypothetical protein
MKPIIKKSVAVFCSTLIVFAIFNFMIILNSENVSAANVDTCPVTVDGNYCIEVPSGTGWGDYGGCDGPGFSNTWSMQTPGCMDVGYCVPSDGSPCLNSVYEIACGDGSNGLFSTTEPAACLVGCCETPSQSCSLEESNVCTVGNGGTFDESIIDAELCNLECADTIKGCFQQPGNCQYGTQKSFNGMNGEFIIGEFCSAVLGCPSHGNDAKYRACGNGVEDDDSWNLYNFDSAGNREGLVESCLPDGMCVEEVGEDGYPHGECLSTNCVDDCPSCTPEVFKTGESLCVNVLSGFYSNEKRSSGLVNYQLNCQNRIITEDYPDEGKTRKSYCSEVIQNDGDQRVAKWEATNAEDCFSCGSDHQDWLDPALFAIGVGPLIVPLMGGDFCTRHNCEHRESGASCVYDEDLWGWYGVGSCNTNVKKTSVPAGTDRCDLCGEGGDAGANMCTRSECNALGDCYFKEEGMAGYGASAAVAVGTFVSVMTLGLIAYVVPIPGAQEVGSAIWGGAIGAVSLLEGTTLLYWGIVAIITSVSAILSTADNVEFELSDDVLKDDKVKLGYAITTTQAFLDELNETEVSDLTSYFAIQDVDSSSLGGDEWVPLVSSLTIAFVADAIYVTIAAMVPYTFFEALGLSFMAKISNTVFPVLALVAMFYTTAESFQTGECYPETDYPYTNSDSCEDCGIGEGQYYCSEDRCDILGGTGDHCLYVPFSETTGTTGGRKGGLCIPYSPSDNQAPEIEKMNATFLDSQNVTMAGPFNSITNVIEVDDDVDWDAIYLDLYLETDEEAKCSYSFIRDISYATGIEFERDEGAKLHSERIDITSVEKDSESGVYVYIRCEDWSAGNVHEGNDHYVHFNFEERPDTVPPSINYIAPSGIQLEEGTSSLPLTLYAYDNHGVAGCKYTKENNLSLSYQEMEGIFVDGGTVQCEGIANNNCKKYTETFDLTEEGWGEEVGTPEKSKMSYPLNILCKDTSGYIMYEPLSWYIEVWETFNLTIEAPEEGEMIEYSEVSIVLDSDRDLIYCTYNLTAEGFNSNHTFTGEDGPSSFTNVESDLIGNPSGLPYTLDVTCGDIAGNVVTKTRNFIVRSDEDAPYPVRIYTSTNHLNIILNEYIDSCVFSNEDSNFVFEDGSEMAGVPPEFVRFYTPLNTDTYHIKCKDHFENVGSFTVYP